MRQLRAQTGVEEIACAADRWLSIRERWGTTGDRAEREKLGEEVASAELALMAAVMFWRRDRWDC